MTGSGEHPAATVGPVRVVGTGLLGTSVGLALRAGGVDVVLADPSRTTVLLSRDVGAGRLPRADEAEPALVVVAAPPDVTGQVVLAELAAHPGAVVTDVASVKAPVAAEVAAGGGDLSRYVGSHPMAGAERSGPTAARPDLFAGRPWVVCAGSAEPASVLAVRALAVDVAATPVMLDAAEHDAAVALVSHLPQVAASLVAARLRDAPATALELAGQGLRDVTRIAASEPGLWTSILAANAGSVAPVLREVRRDLDEVIGALERAAVAGAEPAGVHGSLAGAIAAGNAGVGRIPGKHGGSHATYDVVTVLVPDRPGELGRLLVDMGHAGVNLEELAIDHAPRQAVGLASLSVLPGLGTTLEQELTARGWRVAG
ncbi:prephenate dehydrogenase [Isoptericola sp. b441]|uniref:Prephenate dehydrogenase n=1 Tax=Actinotalea lenta TaxID=3064654 RepID=A0ABT9D9V5_9CELL|nr:MULTISPECIES: prephenate dehydrogenase [unclassified Isoptericola]MDO8107688.1 prephenate dehydrogenase [Isoptericola sp. b441]MDO8120652.1 prephenate dehydrogenase [Isoptericola sp. b490]